MPLYEYQCEQCGNRFEVIQKFSDQPLIQHDGCGGAVQRLISASALQFKGSGWYITDYARSGAKSEPKSDAKSDAKSDTKTEAKTEAKTQSKSESKPATSTPSDK